MHPLLPSDAAARALRAYETRAGRADSKLDPSLLAAGETGAAIAIDQARFQQLEDQGKSSGGPPIRYDQTSFDVPAKPAPSASFLVRGRSSAKGRDPTYLVFERRGGAWKLAYSVPVPRLLELPPQLEKRDGAGVGVNISSHEGLLVAPHSLAVGLVQFLDNGGKGHTKFAPGPFTSEAAKAARQDVGKASSQGVVTQATFSARPYPVVAFATQDGGALVFFSIARSTEISVDPSRYAGGYRFHQDDGRTVLSAFIAPGYYGRVTVNDLVEVAAIVPPAKSATGVRVIGELSGVLSASASSGD